MKANFDLFLTEVLKQEGGYVDHPADPGGATNLGITIGVLSTWLGRPATKAEVKALTVKDVAPIFKKNYWDRVCGDDLPPGVDLATSDFAVNSGVSRSAIYLQEIAGVAPDGKIGPLTIAAVKKLNAAATINTLCDRRLAFLNRLSTFPVFGKGWTARVTAIRKVSLSLTGGSTILATGDQIPTLTLAPATASGTKPRTWMALVAVLGPILYGIGKLLRIV